MSTPTKSHSHLHINQVDWTTAIFYPEELQRIFRWKTLIGNPGPLGSGIAQPEVSMGIQDIDAGGYYPAHAHPAPEIYFVLSGTAEWTVGDETFIAEPSMAIYHAPNMLHRMVNNGTEPVRTVWFWWAPGGDRKVLEITPTLLEAMPGAWSGHGY
ncbi:MAG: cupin domain-containing protein [Gammaproteobacteria bacterium]|nr:cupin domain-containing protein [Gammaproteobacteria bacterium]